MSLRAKLVVFTVLVGIIIVSAFWFFGINLPYSLKYLISGVVIALYIIIVAILERYLRRKRT